MPLSPSQRKHLRGLAHALSPVVIIGQNGMTEAVTAAVEEALVAHELIKVKLKLGDRGLRDEAVEHLCDQLGAECAARIGNVAVLFRRNPERARIALPG